MAESVIQIKNLQKVFGEREVLKQQAIKIIKNQI